MQVRIRRPNGADAEAVAELSLLCNAKYREDARVWVTAADSERGDSGCLVAEACLPAGSREPALVGYGRIAPEHGTPQDSPKYRAYLAVHPEHRRQGIGGAILDWMLDELHTLGAARVRARVQSDQNETLAFLARRGFAEYDHKIVLELKLAELGTTALAASVTGSAARAASEGISIWNLADWRKHDASWLRKLHLVYNAVGHDVPQPDPYDPVTLDEFVGFLAGPDISPEGFYVATSEDDVVGFSYLLEPKGGNHAIVGLTGVLPEFRRHGIATAMKLREVQYARARGISVLVTGAAATNVASIAVNEKLGFRRTWEELRLERRLD